jgi:hypothetical protein
MCRTSAHCAVRDALDACTALDIDIAQRIPDAVLLWYRRLSDAGVVMR